MNVTELLEAGLGVLRERGMCKNSLFNDGRVCARGALLVPLVDAPLGEPLTTNGWRLVDKAMTSEEFEAADEMLTQVVRVKMPSDWCAPWYLSESAFNIAEYNNLPGTTQPDLEAVFEEAIKRSKEQA